MSNESLSGKVEAIMLAVIAAMKMPETIKASRESR